MSSSTTTDVDAQNAQQETALFMACAMGYGNIATILMENRAGLNIVNDLHNSPLHMAIVCDALDVIADLLEHGADVNIKGQQHMSPLQTAVQQGSDAAVKLLLQYNPEMNSQDSLGDTPLNVACKRGYNSKAVILLQYGVNPICKNYSGLTPFDHIVRKYDKILLEAFIKHDPAILNTMMNSLETALHFYCRKGHNDMVGWLIDYGADKDKICARGRPLDVALEHGHENTVFLLINNGAAVTRAVSTNTLGFLERVYRQQQMNILRHIIMSEKCEIDLTDVNEDGETLFFQACKDEAVGVIELLLDSKRDVGINICNKFGKSPVSVVCESCVMPENEAVQILSLLLQSAQDIDVDIADMQHLTPLHIACQNGSVMLVNMLLRASKASINASDVMDRTPLHFANTADLVQLLVKFGADLNKRDYLGQTPLLFSCQKGNREVASAFVGLQTEAINSCDNMRRTVTHHCTAANILDILKDADGLEINNLDINQQSALHISVMNEDIKSTEQLLKMGADPNVKDKSNLSPIHMAKTPKCWKLLTKHKADTKVRSLRGCSPDDMMQWHCQLKANESMDLQRELVIGGHGFLKRYMNMELVGFIETHEKYEIEYHYIRNLLKRFMARLAVEVKKIDPLMEFELMPSGSMNEETKVCMPDEGDFVCLLIRVSEMFEAPTSFSFQTANVMLNLHPDYQGNRPNFVDSDGRAITQLLLQHFYNAVQQALAVPEIWTEFPQLHWAAAADITKLHSKISNVNLMWHGSIFKWMPISVAIVPGILFPSWRPSWCSKRTVLQDTQCCIVAKDIEHAPEDMRPYLFQLDFTDADAEMFRRMSPHLKDGYKLAKLMRMPWICSKMRTEHCQLDQASAYISSYILKTVTFHLHEEYQKSPEKFHFPKDSVPAVEFAQRIYDKLADALKENFLEMYPIPAHDLFRKLLKQHSGHVSDHKVAVKYCEKIRTMLDRNPGKKY